MQKAIKLIESIGTTSEGLSRTFKLLLTVGALLGGYYLACYVVANNLSFPVNIASLVTLIMVFGLTAAIVVAIVAFYVLMGSVTTLNLFGESFADVLNTNWQGLIVPSAARQIRKLLIIFVLPQVVLFSLLADFQNWKHWNPAGMVVIFAAMPLAFGILSIHRSSRMRDESNGKWRVFARSCGIGFYIYIANFVAALSGFFFLYILNLRGLLSSPNVWIGACLFVITVNTLALTNRLRTTLTNSTPLIKGATVNIPDGVYQSTGKFVVMFLLGISLLPPVALQVASATLVVLGIGGGSRQVVYAPIEGKGALPPPLIASCDSPHKTCTSKVVDLLLDAGDFIFVHLPGAKNHQNFRLNAGELSLERDRPDPKL
ncbi:hypothetical protein HDE76_001868 [Rhodanobacter sp. ANJX3]|uniref:hypothetical protein n=1 Tax=Rhodanobacter sp. ANJX3 TaxID=2723083 RepID=UPI0016080300|nr:hypothetical protein [Rhodanobacter sp. ANJX3]MBB5358652.1 hypothetical protein [Rhodanobacter sp. ANJX3]